MFCITVKFKNEPSVWTFMYKTEEACTAAGANTKTTGTSFTLVDDFGQCGLIDKASVAGTLVEDLDKSMLAHVERGLHNARTQAKAETIAASDEVLKAAAARKQRGPAIYSPQNNGFQG